jgi:hypothetical protein
MNALDDFVNGLLTIQHSGNTRNLNAKVGTKKIGLDRNSRVGPKTNADGPGLLFKPRAATSARAQAALARPAAQTKGKF